MTETDAYARIDTAIAEDDIVRDIYRSGELEKVLRDKGAALSRPGGRP